MGDRPQPSIFYEVFRGLLGKVVIVELKNHVRLRGTLRVTDPILNLFLDDVETVDAGDGRVPMLCGVTSLFIRASAIQYVSIASDSININKLVMQCAAEK